MKRTIICIFLLAAGTKAAAQTDSIVLPEPQITTVQALIDVALMNSAELRASTAKVESEIARVKQSGILPPPELRLMEENMPGIDPRTAMFQRIELMQMIPFPTKLSADRAVANMFTLHAGHDQVEFVGSLIARLKRQYAELWFVQQNLVLQEEQRRILHEILDASLQRYKTGLSRQQEVLKVSLQLSEAENDTLMLRQKEKSLQAMLSGAASGVTVRSAVIQEGLTLIPPLDTLLTEAKEYRSMLLHDSLNILQQRAVADRAAQEYFPDISIGLQRVTSPIDDFRGWSFSVGITLPFAPWSLAGVSAKREESAAMVRSAEATYEASVRMVESAIKDRYYEATASRQKLANMRTVILPQARQLLSVCLTGYRTGTTDFQMLLDSERMYLDEVKEYYSTRMMFEQSVADLEREVGTQFFLVSK
jgi:cobalt-zinc-cadmium efflux system outer membrane protein